MHGSGPAEDVSPLQAKAGQIERREIGDRLSSAASSTGRSAGRGRPLPAPDDRLRAITPLAASWSRGSDAWPSQVQAKAAESDAPSIGR